MKRLMMVLSGEHPTLPTAEAMAAIKAEHKSYKVVDQLDQVLIAETKASPEVLASRLAMCREICWHLCTAQVKRPIDVLQAISSSDIVDLLPHGKTFAVHMRRVKRYLPDINLPVLEKRIADLIMSEIDFKVDLTRPDVDIIGILTSDYCVIGVSAAHVERTKFTLRRPTMRAAFHPSTLMPLLARAMVNLARTSRNGTLLDPFCGVGGILIEAGLIGAKPIGVDIDAKMIDGARQNLEAFGVKDYQLLVGDARHLNVPEVGAVATDPPYGRQATTAGVELKEVYGGALPSIAQVLKRKGYVCITSPAGLELEGIAQSAGLRMIEKHEQRVHKSLTRSIYVMKKK